jgi:H+/Cl- antiporter ClcA
MDKHTIGVFMKRISKYLIVGAIISFVLITIIFILFYKYLFKEMFQDVKIPIMFYFKLIFLGILGLLFGSVGYTLVKLYHDWFNSHFIVFTKNPIQRAFVTFIVDPLIGVFGFIGLGYFLIYKIGFIGKLLGIDI